MVRITRRSLLLRLYSSLKKVVQDILTPGPVQA